MVQKMSMEIPVGKSIFSEELLCGEIADTKIDHFLCRSNCSIHIALGSSHGVTVDENKKMYYMWMDFFLTKEGQEWLKRIS